MSDFVKAVSSADKVCIRNGVNNVAVGTGIADVTVGAPSPGFECAIQVKSRTSGDLVVTCVGGTFDGTNNTATFDAVGEFIILVYNDHDEWAIKASNGVVLSAV